MAKTSGLGNAFYLGGYDLSGDINALGAAKSTVGLLDATGIDKSANERMQGLRDGAMEVTSFFNPATDRAHPRLSALPVTNVIATYCFGTVQGDEAAGLLGRQVDYSGKRGDDGALMFETSIEGDGYGLEWGRQATAGIETCTNQLTGQNTGFEGGIGTWVTAGAAATVAASSAQARTGTGSLAITATSTTDAAADHIAVTTSGFAVTAGRAYTAQAWYRAATLARSVQTTLRWYDAGGASVSGTVFGNLVANTTSGWTISRANGVAPATAVFAVLRTTIASPGGAGEVHYVDDVSFFANPLALDLGTGSLSFGLAAYLHVTAFTGTDATITLQGSSDNAVADPFANITGGAFTAVTAVGAQRIATGTTQTIERYIRPNVTTTDGFSALSYAVMVVRNDQAPLW